MPQAGQGERRTPPHTSDTWVGGAAAGADVTGSTATAPFGAATGGTSTSTSFQLLSAPVRVVHREAWQTHGDGHLYGPDGEKQFPNVFGRIFQKGFSRPAGPPGVGTHLIYTTLV